jgi:hypothetical protein
MASKSLGTLTLNLVAQVGGFVSGLDKAERATEKWKKQVERDAKKIGVAFAAAGVAAAAGLTALVKSSIDAADELSKTSTIVGVAIDDLSGLKHAAELSGVEFNELESDLIKFNKTTADAFEGIGAGAEAYEKLGVSVKNTDGTLKNNYELIQEVADQFQLMEDGAQKAALAQDLFGRGGAKLIPLLNGGAEGLAEFREEAERLGLVLDQDTGKAAEEFNDNVDRLTKNVTGLGNQIATELLPELVDISRAFLDINDNGSAANSIAEGLGKTLKVVTATAIGFVGAFDLVAKSLAGLAAIGKTATEGGLGIAGVVPASLPFVIAKNWDNVKTQLDIVGDDLDTTANEYADLLNKIWDAGGDKPAGETPAKAITSDLEALHNQIVKTASGRTFDFFDPFAEGAAETNEELEKLLDNFENVESSLQRQLALNEEASELQQIRYEIEHGSLVGINEQQQKRLEGLAAEIDKHKELQAQEEERNELTREYKAVRDGLINQDVLLTEQAEDRAQVLKRALDQGIISETEFGELVILNSEKLKEQIDQIKEKTNELDEFTKNAARSIQSELSDAIVGGFEGGSEDLLKRWGRLLERLVADAIAADLTRALFGQTNGGGQMGTGTLITNFAGLFAGLFDGGGSIGHGQFGIVGENGPEIVRGPAVVTGRMETEKIMSGNSVGNVTMNFPGVTNAQEARRAAGAAGRELLSVIQGAQRYA